MPKVPYRRIKRDQQAGTPMYWPEGINDVTRVRPRAAQESECTSSSGARVRNCCVWQLQTALGSYISAVQGLVIAYVYWISGILGWAL